MYRPDMARLWSGLLCVVLVLAFYTPSAHASGREIEVTEAIPDGDELLIRIFTPGGPALDDEAFGVTVNDLSATSVRATPGVALGGATGAVLVVDTSGSMVGRPIQEAKAAIATFVDSLPSSADIALVTFADAADVAVRPGRGRGAVSRAAAGLRADGETALHDAIVRASSLVEGRSATERNIVILTDGADTVSGATFPTALEAVRRSGATVFVVAIRSPEFSIGTVAPLARRTGGKLVTTSDVSELSDVFRSLAQGLVSAYELRVTHPDPQARRLDVEVTVTRSKRVLRGVGSFDLPVMEERGDFRLDFPSPSGIPLPFLLLVLFLGLAALVFFATDALHRRGRSPAQRVAWYTAADEDEGIDKSELISLAVLQRAKALATDVAARRGWTERLEKELDVAMMSWRPGEMLLASALMAMVAGFLGLASANLPIAALLAVVAGTAPFAYVHFKAAARRNAFADQLADVLTMLTGALRAGYSLQQAVGAVGNDASPPASEEFGRVLAEVRLGSSLDDALADMSTRMRMLDLDWTVLAIQIQREVGGDLGEIFEVISSTIRERERLRGKIKALTAEGRFSALVLGALPFVMAVVLTMKSPNYLNPLFENTKGLWMLGISGVLMMVGFGWMRKIIRIEV